MNISVKGTEEYGNQLYADLFKRILVDLGLANRIEEARILILPEKPLFLISVRTRKARTTVKLEDVASVEEKGDNTYLNISNESYAPVLLANLWKRFGRERIEQLSRLEILCHGIKSDRIRSIELDPGQELKKELLDALWRLMPEGFKVHHTLSSDTVMTIAATEHIMTDELVSLAKQLQLEMESSTVSDESGTEDESEEEDG
ncbi:MAG: methanogenesis marker 17 protein [Methanomassiliicoccales archaeon]|nr:methanogenesis marker 17 protein [Methanomassiliicoccales archaeon]